MANHKAPTESSPSAASVLNEQVEVLGVIDRPGIGTYLAVRRAGEAVGPTWSIPMELLTPGKHTPLSEWLARAGGIDLVAEFHPKEIASAFRNAAAVSNTRVIDRHGYHQVEHRGASFSGVAAFGRWTWFDSEPTDVSVILVGNAASAPKATASLEDFSEEMGPLLVACPRVLVVLCFALAASFRTAFGVPSLALALIGTSSKGKSIVQSAVAHWTLGSGEVLTMNATEHGLQDYMAARPNLPVFFEDAHGASSATALLSGIMNAGNSGRRLRSGNWANNEAVNAVNCTLIISAESDVQATARAGRQAQHSGVHARVFTLHMGEYGMFDDLCGFADGAKLARHVQAAGPRFSGLIGAAMSQKVAEEWKELRRRWKVRRDMVRQGISEAAEAGELGALDGRLLDGLTFVAFIGCHLGEFGIAEIKRKDVYRAFGSVFAEHLERQRGDASPVAQDCIEAVAYCIQSNLGKFLPIAQADDQDQPSGLLGYRKTSKGETLYLFFPGAFKERFEKKFGSEIYGHLHDAGVLVKPQKGYNQLLVRVGESRRYFIAVRASILHAGDDG